MTSTELGEVATSGCLGEYRDMFVLSEADLTAGPILDCPGGASSFGAQVRARGGDVVSVDPMYHATAAEILRRSAESRRRIHHYQSDHPDQFHWPYLGSPAANLRCAEVSADLFGVDFAANPGGSYHIERHPVAADVLDNTRAQMELMSTEPGGPGGAPAGVEADGLRGGEPVPDREDQCDRDPLRLRRGR